MYEKVKGFDDYEIDENGNVYSLKNKKIMKQYLFLFLYRYIP